MNIESSNYRTQWARRDTRIIRTLPVNRLTADECRRLLVHHHGRPVDPLRRKAYLLKAHPGSESAFFKAGEIAVIEHAITEGI